MKKFGIKIDWLIFSIRALVSLIIGISILILVFSVTKIEFPDVYFVKNFSIEWAILTGVIFLFLSIGFLNSKWVDRKLEEYKNSADRSQTKIKLNKLIDQSYGIAIAFFIAAIFYGCAFPNDNDDSHSSDDGPPSISASGSMDA